MIIDCLGGSHPLLRLEEGGFFSTVKTLMTFVIPAAIGYALWRIFVTNRTGPEGTTILGLDENSAIYKEAYDRGISWRTLFIYSLTGLVFVFEAYQYVVDLIRTN